MQHFARFSRPNSVELDTGVSVPEQDLKEPKVAGYGPKDHLAHLLPPDSVEKLWFLEIFQNIKDLISPPKLPPLELTSKPVPIEEIKIYAGNESRAGVASLLIHVGAVALLLFVASLKPVQDLVKQQVTALEVDLRPYLSQQKKQASSGGGGGGARQPLDASKGKLPKPAPRQFTPPRVDPIPDPKLPMIPTVIAPDDVPNIQANNYGDPISRLGIPSNGIGFGGGIGSGSGGGVGPGKGAGVGPGSGGGFGGGAYRIGGGVSAPSVLSKVEPEYSEEARKAKWQGTVILALVVDDQGRPQNLKVLRSLGLGLDQKAIEAVEKWRFKPGMKDGKPVPVMATIEVNFRLL